MAFDLVFGFFVAAMAAIAVLAIRWAIGRDRAERRSRDQTGDGTSATDGIR